MTFEGSSCPTSTPSGLSLLYFPGLPPSAYAGSPDTCASVLPYRHWPSSRKEKPLAAPTSPLESASCGSQFSASGPFALATALLFARLTGLTRPGVPKGFPGLPRLLLPGFQVIGSPLMPAGYDYGAKLRIAPAGLSPASTAASLAAPFLQRSRHDSGMAWRPPRSRCSAYVRAWVLRHRGIPAPLAISVGRMLPSAKERTSASRTINLSVLNSPARTRPCQRLTPILANDGP